jgi:crotonobetainyl-CoA:carnitine CoA-transferase CaiB-like acyl-CoA transferase
VNGANGTFSAREAPAQGEHSRDVLREAGYDGATIDALIAGGVVRAVAAESC